MATLTGDVGTPVRSPRSRISTCLQFVDRGFATVEKHAKSFAAGKARTVLVVSFAAIVLRVSILWFLPVPLPQIHDEFSYLLAADTFAHGRLTNPTHPMWLFFDTFHVLQHPSYASKYPPGQGALLALGQRLGHPWVGVLLSMAAMSGAITWMLQGFFPARWALVGALLMFPRLDLFSYWMNSYWGGAVAATGGALVLGAFPRVVRHRRTRDALILGVGAALLLNSRPFEGFLFCLPIAAAILIWIFAEQRSALAVLSCRVLAPVVLVLTATLLFTGYYNWRVTGNPLLFPEMLTQRQYENFPLFAWQTPNPPLHYANAQFNDFYNSRIRTRYPRSWSAWARRSWERCSVSRRFFLGNVLCIPFITLLWLVRDKRMRIPLIQLLCTGLGLLAVVYFEPHYAAPLTGTITILLVQAMRHLRQWTPAGHRVGVAVSRLIVLALLINVPMYIWQSTSQAGSKETFAVSRARIMRQLESRPGRHLIIVRYSAQHIPDKEWVYNAADIDAARVVWAREIPGHSLQPLLDYFRDRKVWIMKGDDSPPQLLPFDVTRVDSK